MQFEMEFDDNNPGGQDAGIGSSQTTVWVVYTPAAEPLRTDDQSLNDAIKEIMAENEQFLQEIIKYRQVKAKAGLPAEEHQIELSVPTAESIKAGRIRYNSNLPGEIEHACFTRQSSAEKLAEYLENQERPVQVIQMSSSSVTTKMDLYERQIAAGYRPFTVLMMDGGLFEYWGYASPWDCDVSTIDPVHYAYSERGEEQMSGTFWGIHGFDAVDKAEAEWEKLYNQGVFKTPLQKEDVD
jgi:hypothetical protein